MQNRTLRKHLTATERGAIESMLREGRSMRYIADSLNKAPSSISKEISKHALQKSPKICDCINFSSCRLKKVCNSDTSCRKNCRNCPAAKKY